MPDFSNYMFGPLPALHTPPAYRPVGNPPVQMPAAPQNLVATILEWEIPTATPPLHPINTRRATPYPTTRKANPVVVRHDPPILALPWYGIGGVPECEDQHSDMEVPALLGVTEEEEAAFALAGLQLDVPSSFSARGTLRRSM